jgi:hypothetical protein
VGNDRRTIDDGDPRCRRCASLHGLVDQRHGERRFAADRGAVTMYFGTRMKEGT